MTISTRVKKLESGSAKFRVAMPIVDQSQSNDAALVICWSIDGEVQSETVTFIRANGESGSTFRSRAQRDLPGASSEILPDGVIALILGAECA